MPPPQSLRMAVEPLHKRRGQAKRDYLHRGTFLSGHGLFYRCPYYESQLSLIATASRETSAGTVERSAARSTRTLLPIRTVGISPSRIRRRTVASLTPSDCAASRTGTRAGGSAWRIASISAARRETSARSGASSAARASLMLSSTVTAGPRQSHCSRIASFLSFFS
jgi:hypothetical protein